MIKAFEVKNRMNVLGKISLVVVSVLLFCATARSENVLGPKLSVIYWGNNVTTIADKRVEFASDNILALGFEENYLFKQNFSVGGEFMFHELDVKSFAGDHNTFGNANVYHLNAILKYYFPINHQIKPFIGGGFGFNRFSVHSEENAILAGYNHQGNLGIDFKFSRRVGLMICYKRSYLSVNDDADNEMKSHNNEISMRLNLYSAK